MQDINRTTTTGRGVIASDYLLDSSWKSVEAYMQHLANTKLNYGPFNYVQAEMSNKTGRYSLYYVTNSDALSSYKKINPDDSSSSPFYFALSNSALDRPFNKVSLGNVTFRNLIEDYSKTTFDKARLVQGILDLMQNQNENVPDDNLVHFMRRNSSDDAAVKGVSRFV
jgi:uncharacterized protein with NRDE domain